MFTEFSVGELIDMETITKQENDDHIVYEFNSGESRIAISLMDDGGVSLESNLKEDIAPDMCDEEDTSWNDAIDGMESLLMGLVGEGFDISGEHGFNAIQTALDGIGNNI